MKRHLQEEGGSSFCFEPRDSKLRRFALISLKNVIGAWSTGDIVSRLEPFLRSVVKDEVERAINNFDDEPIQRSLLPTTETSEPELGLELQFIGNLPATIFTGSKILTEDGSPIRLELFDATTNRIVSTGPLSATKVEILVLDGDFGSDERKDWTETDFNRYIVREREGKRPLLSGETSINLRGGSGRVEGLAFTDNSSWVRSRKFRLGARVFRKGACEVRIKEARSETFMVKDHRGELYKKHHPPRLYDEVWRLEKISRDGTFHKRLTQHRIHSVKDFLRMYEIDPLSLRNVLGSGIPTKIWEAIVEHANECVVDDDKFYGFNHTSEKHGVIFNSVYKVVGATFDGQSFVPLDKLTAHQKVSVQKMKKQALENPHHLFPVDAVSTVAPAASLSLLGADPFLLGSGPFLQPLEFPIPHQGQPEYMHGFGHSSIPTLSFMLPESSKNNRLPISTRSGNISISGECWPGEIDVLPEDSSRLVSPILDHHSADEENIFEVQTPFRTWVLDPYVYS